MWQMTPSDEINILSKIGWQIRQSTAEEKARLGESCIYVTTLPDGRVFYMNSHDLTRYARMERGLEGVISFPDSDVSIWYSVRGDGSLALAAGEVTEYGTYYNRKATEDDIAYVMVCYMDNIYPVIKPLLEDKTE